MTATSIAFKLASLFFAGGIFFILFKRIKVLKKYGIVSVLYALLFSVILPVPVLLMLFDSGLSDIQLLVIAQMFIALSGCIFVIATPSAIPWFPEQRLNMKILYTLCILLIAYFFCNLTITFLVDPKLESVWYFSLLWFAIPILLNETVNYLLLVPRREYIKWYYPVGERIDDPEDDELENPVVISFIFRKKEENTELTTFRAKAPLGMKLGRLFYFFINDYNSRHPESQISFTENNGQPDGWVFMKVKNRFFKLKNVIDPNYTIQNNKIKENDILICNRILKNELK